MHEMTDIQRECAALIMALVDDELSAEQRDRLNAICRDDQDCRKLYTAVMSVHGMLLWSSHLSATQAEQQDESDAFLFEIYEQARLNRIKLDAEVELAKNLEAQAREDEKRQALIETEQVDPQRRVIIIPKLAVYSGLAAAILLVGVLLWPLIEDARSRSNVPSEPEVAEVIEVGPEAELVRSQDAAWNRAIPADGILTGTEAWTLKKGFAEIAMPSGASVILQGPATFRLIDDNKLAMDAGRLTAEVPDRAKFFTVKTNAMDVVDLGTRFGVAIEAGGAASTSVFEGEVEVNEPLNSADGAPRVVSLIAGQEISADANGKLAEAVTAVDPDHGYVSSWEAIQHRVVVRGQARFFNRPPKSVHNGKLLNTNRLVVFQESTVVLDRPLEVMINLPQKQSATMGTIPAGRKVVSYFIHSEPEAADKSSFATATLTFPGRVLGVLGQPQQLRDTNASFGLGTVDYIPDSDRSTYGMDPRTPDNFVIGGPQGNVLTIHLAAGQFADQARVIVELPDATGDR